MSFSPLIRQLIDSLRILPGVGQKTAQRMALQLLERDRSGGSRLSQALRQAMEGVGHCKQCRTLTEEELCPQCSDVRRDDTLLRLEPELPDALRRRFAASNRALAVQMPLGFTG